MSRSRSKSSRGKSRAAEIEAAYEAALPGYKTAARRAALWLAGTGEPFRASDVRAVSALDPIKKHEYMNQWSWLAGVLLKLEKEGRLTRVGTEVEGERNHTVVIWQGVKVKAAA